MLEVAKERFPDAAPIFVVGAPRSGTTLLTRVLDGHPDVAIADELIFYDIILEARSVVPDLDTPERIDAFFGLLPKMDHVRYWSGLDEVLAETRRRLLADPHPTYGRFFLLLMEIHAERQGARRYGDKTPWNVRHLDLIVTNFPNARIIHLVRDPRANVASRRKLPRTSTDVLTNAVKWKLDIQAARRFAAGPLATAANYMEVRYEDLVTDLEPHARRICSFIGEPWDDGMLSFHESKDIMFRDQPWKEGVLKPAHTGSLEQWRKELTPPQVGIIERVCAAEMRTYGYEPARPRASLAAVAARLPGEIAAWRSFKRTDAARQREDTGIEFRHGAAPLYALMLKTAGARLRRLLGTG